MIGDIIRNINQCMKDFKTIFLIGKNNNKIKNLKMILNYKTRHQISLENKKVKKMKTMKIRSTFLGKLSDLKICTGLMIKSTTLCASSTLKFWCLILCQQDN